MGVGDGGLFNFARACNISSVRSTCLGSGSDSFILACISSSNEAGRCKRTWFFSSGRKFWMKSVKHSGLGRAIR